MTNSLKFEGAAHLIRVEANLGFATVTLCHDTVLVAEHGGEAQFAQVMVDSLVARAQREAHIAFDPRVRVWSFIVGAGIDNVVGRLYRGFMASDFHSLPRQPDIRICRGVLVPEDRIAHPCAAYPGCLEWAIYYFGVLKPIHDFFLGQTWEEGDTIWVCPRHAHEVHKADYYWDHIGRTRPDA